MRCHVGMSLLCRHNFEHNRWGKESGNILELSHEFSEYPGIIVTAFAKRGLPHTSNIAYLMSYNFCSVCSRDFKTFTQCSNVLLLKF